MGLGVHSPWWLNASSVWMLVYGVKVLQKPHLTVKIPDITFVHRRGEFCPNRYFMVWMSCAKINTKTDQWQQRFCLFSFRWLIWQEGRDHRKLCLYCLINCEQLTQLPFSSIVQIHNCSQIFFRQFTNLKTFKQLIQDICLSLNPLLLYFGLWKKTTFDFVTW